MSQRKQTNRNFVASKARDESAREGPADCSRRDCIKRSALALAGMALASHSAIAVTTAPKKIRMGVIGGGFGASFYWHKHPDCIVEAVSDLREDRRRLLMKTYNCPKAYNSLEELVLDKNIDAVAIFTDGPLHVQHAIEAMKNGKHVISAVPACWGTVEQAEMLLDAVKKYGLTYMMAETSYYYPFAISVRKYYEQGQFGEIFDSESDYLHDGLESLYFHNGKRTWRYGVAPMHYPTHNTVFPIMLGERLTEVSCNGWGDDSPILKDNVYKNPFWNETAMFTTKQGHSFRMRVWWKGPIPDGVRASWFGTKMSFITPQGGESWDIEPVILRVANQKVKDEHGYDVNLPAREKYKQVEWANSEMLPEALRVGGLPPGHGGSELFLTHEFIDALVHGRKPTIDIYEALAYTVPGILAHESALRNGERMRIPQFDPS